MRTANPAPLEPKLSPLGKCFLPRFLPLQRLSSHEEPPTPARSHLIRLRCALRVSHPLDALLPSWPTGLISSRSRSWGPPCEALLPLLVPCALSSTASLLELVSISDRSLSFRAFHTIEVPPGGARVSCTAPADAPLGFFPFGVSCFAKWLPPLK